MTIPLRRLLLTMLLCICSPGFLPDVVGAEDTMNIDDSVSWNREHRGDKYAIFSKTASAVITPYIYDDYLSFVDGIAAASIDGKWGVVDTAGTTVIPFKYDYLFYFYHGNDKSREHGRTKACRNGKWGYINIHENQVIPLIYDELHESAYNDDWRYALARLNGKWGVINHDGAVLIPFEYDEMGFGNSDDKNGGVIVWVAKGEADFMVVVDHSGNRYYYSETGALYQGLTWARDLESGLVGFMKADGSRVADPAYDAAGEFHDGMARVWLNGQYGFVDANGKLVIAPAYQVALEPNGGAILQMPLDYVPPPLPEGIEQSSIGPHAYLSMMIRHDWEAMYGENGVKAAGVGDFACGLALVRLNGRYGYINKQNIIAIAPQYEQATMFRQFEYKPLFGRPRTIQAASVMLNGKWTLIDRQGNYVARYK